MSEPFIAEIKIFAGNFPPRGYAFCEGQLLPIAQNTALFSLVGTTYGGDGRTTLGLPNLQGRFPMHPGRGPGLSDRRLGQVGGTETVTLSVAQMPAHTHAWAGTDEDASTDNPAGARLAVQRDDAYGLGSEQNMMATGLEGGGQAHNNVSPYLAMYFIIALVGIYPSRS